jgi:hypothetical protein
MLRLLKEGMTGDDVLAVQQGLNVWAKPNQRIVEDGKFGSGMLTRVRQYQQENRLQLDGIVGPETRHTIFPTIVMTAAVVANVLRFPKIGSNSVSSNVGDPPPADPFSPNLPIIPGILPPIIPGQPTSPSISPSLLPQIIDNSTLGPTRFSGLKIEVQAPQLPSFFQPFGFSFDHCEAAPGTQHTFNFTRARQDAFVLTMQCIGVRGPAEDKHQELVFGTQFGQPLFSTDPQGNAWTFSPFVQLTDVDRFGAAGDFHFWQPYAQAAFQGTGFQGAGVSGPGSFSPTIGLTVFPINLGFDIGKFLTLTAGAGLSGNYLMDENRLLLGGQITFGANFKIFSLKSF